MVDMTRTDNMIFLERPFIHTHTASTTSLQHDQDDSRYETPRAHKGETYRHPSISSQWSQITATTTTTTSGGSSDTSAESIGGPVTPVSQHSRFYTDTDAETADCTTPLIHSLDLEASSSFEASSPGSPFTPEHKEAGQIVVRPIEPVTPLDSNKARRSARKSPPKLTESLENLQSSLALAFQRSQILTGTAALPGSSGAAGVPFGFGLGSSLGGSYHPMLGIYEYSVDKPLPNIPSVWRIDMEGLVRRSSAGEGGDNSPTGSAGNASFIPEVLTPPLPPKPIRPPRNNARISSKTSLPSLRDHAGPLYQGQTQGERGIENNPSKTAKLKKKASRRPKTAPAASSMAYRSSSSRGLPEDYWRYSSVSFTTSDRPSTRLLTPSGSAVPSECVDDRCRSGYNSQHEQLFYEAFGHAHEHPEWKGKAKVGTRDNRGNGMGKGKGRVKGTVKESRRERKIRRKEEAEAFDQNRLPSLEDMYDANQLEVISEKGERVRFGDLIKRRRTIVIFIRHWFCPLCAQYMTSIVTQVRPQDLEEADVDLVIIGNGSYKMLPAYKNKAFKCPYPMYTDPSLELYRTLGLTRQTGDAGPDDEAGDYLVQSGFEATVSTLKRAAQMPLKNPGHFTQLGGEFVFDGSLNCTFAHRMTTTRSHAPIREVCSEAGVRLEWVHFEPGEGPPGYHAPSLSALDLLNTRADSKAITHRGEGTGESSEGENDNENEKEDESAHASAGASEEGARSRQAAQRSLDMQWQEERNDEMNRIRRLKEARRSGMYWNTPSDARRQIRVIGFGQDEGESVQPVDALTGEFVALGFADEVEDVMRRKMSEIRNRELGLAA